MQKEKWVVTPFEGGLDTVYVAIYFSFRNSCRNRKDSVTKSYFSEFCSNQTFNVAT